MSTPVPTPASAPATNASADAAKSWAVPTWMNLRQPDGSLNMAGIVFWLVILVALVVVANFLGLVHLWAVSKIGNGEARTDEFYSDL